MGLSSIRGKEIQWERDSDGILLLCGLGWATQCPTNTLRICWLQSKTTSTRKNTARGMRKTVATHREQRRCREEMPHFGRGAGLASSHKWPHVDAQLTVHKIAGTLYSTTLGHGDMPIPILIRKIFQLPPAEHKKKHWAPPHWADPWLPRRPGKQPHLETASAASVGWRAANPQSQAACKCLFRRMVCSTSPKNKIGLKCPAVSNLLSPTPTQGHLLQAATLRPPGFHHFWWLGMQMIQIHPVLAVLGYSYGILLWDIIMEYHGDEWKKSDDIIYHHLKVNWTNFAMYLPALLFTGGTMFWFAATVWRLRTPAIAPLPAAEMLGASTCQELSDRRPSR